jgi:tetratricopeptide (TPR) repeat protein
VTDPQTPPEVFSYLGSLRKDQGRFDEAAQYLHRAATLYGLLRRPEKAARILLNLGTLHYRLHEPHAAVEADQRALGLLDDDSEDWLRGYAHYNLAHHLHAGGETDRAEAELTTHEELLAACGEEVDQHVVWLKARIAWSRQDLAAAQRLYTEARARALARGIVWDAGLVGLELALVHLARGRTARVRKLAREALEVFAEQQVERETRAALDLLDAAARRDALTRDLLEQTITAVERAAHARPATVREPR